MKMIRICKWRLLFSSNLSTQGTRVYRAHQNAFQAAPREIGWLAAAQSLPFLLLALPFGWYADIGSRRQLLLFAEGLRLLAMFGLLALAFTQHVSITGLALLGFLGATGTVAFTVAAPTLMPKLVPAQQLGFANSRLELARSLA
jgi:MFS family permease